MAAPATALASSGTRVPWRKASLMEFQRVAELRLEIEMEAEPTAKSSMVRR
jgi:hypothetical protein